MNFINYFNAFSYVHQREVLQAGRHSRKIIIIVDRRLKKIKCIIIIIQSQFHNQKFKNAILIQ